MSTWVMLSPLGDETLAKKIPSQLNNIFVNVKRRPGSSLTNVNNRSLMMNRKGSSDIPWEMGLERERTNLALENIELRD